VQVIAAPPYNNSGKPGRDKEIKPKPNPAGIEGMQWKGNGVVLF
jgi:hypothetical protein